MTRAWVLSGLLVVGWSSLTGCNRPPKSEGEKLARTYCAACHAFPEPQLLDKKTWESGVLPQMGKRLGRTSGSLFDELSRNPHMMVLNKAVSEEQWEKIVRYYRELAPDSLPAQSLPAQPRVDPDFFKVSPFAPQIQSSGIITLLKTDSAHQRVFVGEAGSNLLRVFDWSRRQISSVTLGSPPTDLIVDGDSVLVLESGILNPNDQPRGALVKYGVTGTDSLRSPRVLIDSLFRPVFVQQYDFGKGGRADFVICEFGDNIGRLALYRYDGSRYNRQVLDPGPGAIQVDVRDMTGDGAPDIVALFAQANERIVLFVNDGKGKFPESPRILARFPPVYGSQSFFIHDFNGDGKLDIVYVNGDNYDLSRVLKPYHGVRILENDGRNNFHERYFFPMYGAARVEVADFDKDGDLDMMVASNFPDLAGHPERGIMFLENVGRYAFQPYAFTASSGNQWNGMAIADLNRDGRPDVIVGAMDLAAVSNFQRRMTGPALATGKTPILFFENTMQAKPATR